MVPRSHQDKLKIRKQKPQCLSDSRWEEREQAEPVPVMGHAALLMEKRITQEAEAGAHSARGPTRQSKAPSLATPGSRRVETVSRPGRRYSHLSVSCVSASHENTQKGLRGKKKIRSVLCTCHIQSNLGKIRSAFPSFLLCLSSTTAKRQTGAGGCRRRGRNAPGRKHREAPALPATGLQT